MSKIKNVLGKLTFLKSYTAYILPVILLIVAVGLLITGSFLNSGLRNNIEKDSIKLGSSVKSYSAQKIPAKQWQVEKQYQDALEADANAIENMLKQTTQRELLSYKLFPEPKDTSVLIFEEFGKYYRQAVENLVSKYDARECPTEVEINKALEQTRSDNTRTRSTGRIRMGMPGAGSRRSGFSSRGLGEVEQMIVDELCYVAAEDARFYASPLSIPGYEYWKKQTALGSEDAQETYAYISIQQSVSACWYWQLGYWIIEDVFKTINSMNSGPGNVIDYPVKRLMEVNFGSSSGSARRSRTASIAGASTPPRYITSANGGLVSSYTGRVSDERWDIVHFRVIVIVKSQSVLPFIDELCSAKEHTFRGWSGTEPEQTFKHNQITVLETNITPVVVNDSGRRSSADVHELYRYGDDAVVEVEFVCEYIFERAGYDEIKPEFIKNPMDDEDR